MAATTPTTATSRTHFAARRDTDPSVPRCDTVSTSTLSHSKKTMETEAAGCFAREHQ